MADILPALISGGVGGVLAYFGAHLLDDRRIKMTNCDAICADIDEITKLATSYWKTDAGEPDSMAAYGAEQVITARFRPLERDIKAYKLKHRRTLLYEARLRDLKIEITRDPFGSRDRTIDPERISKISDLASRLKHTIRGTPQ